MIFGILRNHLLVRLKTVCSIVVNAFPFQLNSQEQTLRDLADKQWSHVYKDLFTVVSLCHV